MNLQHTIKAVVQKGEQSGYVAFCVDLPVTTQGETVDQTIANLNEAVALHLQGENLAQMGFVARPVIMVTMELEPLYAEA